MICGLVSGCGWLDCYFGWVCKLVLRPTFWACCVGLSVGSFLDLVVLGVLGDLWILFCFGDLRCGGIWWLRSVLVGAFCFWVGFSE